jgi:peptidoglycan/LPS O-acetylase OafA/YrhL
MIEFASGVIASGYLVVAAVFFILWRRRGDQLLRAFALAFLLFALNQVLASALVTPTDPPSLIYALRILGFVIIFGALLERNFKTPSA